MKSGRPRNAIEGAPALAARAASYSMKRATFLPELELEIPIVGGQKSAAERRERR
jgi:hypothetical protein